MLLPLILASTTVQLRSDAPALRISQASEMSATALGDALLAPGHPAAVAKHVDQNDDPPMPPGFPVQAVIRLDLAAVPSNIMSFCQRSIAVIRFKPAIKRQDGTFPAAAPDTLSVQTGYHWARGVPSIANCAAPNARFFVPEEGQQETAISTVRLFMQIRDAARSRQRLPFALSIDDDLGRDLAAIDHDDPKNASGKKQVVLTDARKALASLPIDGIEWAGAAQSGFPDPLLCSDLASPSGHKLDGRLVQVLDNWTVAMVLDKGRVVRVRILRQTPPPF